MTDFDNDISQRSRDEFEKFMRVSKERLRIALTASFGAADGRTAAVDALSWAWEHRDRVKEMSNPVGYLYRVGQTSARRIRPRPIPVTGDEAHVDAQRISIIAVSRLNSAAPHVYARLCAR